MPSDRFYTRSDYPRPRTTALVWMVAAMVAVFVLQSLLLLPWFGASHTMPDALRLTVRSLEQAQVWTLLTHGLLHSTGFPLHIIFSLLMLILLGRELEPQLEARRFVLLFAAALVVGGMAWLAVHWNQGGTHIGPSAGLMALLVVLARLYEDQRMSFMPFFLFTLTVRPMQLVYGLAVIDTLLLLFVELPGSDLLMGYAASAHLGGMATGWLYFRFFHANNGWDRAPGFSLPAWIKNAGKARPAPSEPAVSRPARDPYALKADVDRILDKINSVGFAALTDEEKQTLDDAKDLLSKR
ncbi:rhomboid family intramembrane serine protease [Oleiharenicola lentus]|uniref:Rhomboid family intramembrane serine protease n=1 Tax=Oleiharenicola lentus TaxID=2508720 RepID=A0A4Q1C3D2_9BACT|nr:rhomboid family intramembrane serine protease [Oleiharenicola lentus]RXK52831.1 rhomboid family intramembrane serine protease [Oleiharenicola lentus]